MSHVAIVLNMHKIMALYCSIDYNTDEAQSSISLTCPREIEIRYLLFMKKEKEVKKSETDRQYDTR